MAHREIFDFSQDGFKEIFACDACDTPVATEVGSNENLCHKCRVEERHNVSVNIDYVNDKQLRYTYNINERNPQMAAVAYFSGFMFACRKMKMKLWDIMRWSYKLAFSMSEMTEELKEEHEPLFDSFSH